jgi:hypothetical protein
MLAACVLLAAAAAAEQTRITNARLTPHTVTTLSQTFRSLLAGQDGVAWIGYGVPVRDRDRVMCCWTGANGATYASGSLSRGDATCCGECRLEPASGPTAAARQGSGAKPQEPVKLEGAERMVVLFRVMDRRVERIRTFSEDCELDAGGRQVHWLGNVEALDSVALLDSIVAAEPEPGSRVTHGALQAISMHAGPAAAATIERLARSHEAAAVRSNALFWLAQMAGEKVAGTIAAAIENDPDTDVKRRAVFALGQLPRNEGVPLLIDVARKNKNPAVRRQAIFWLGQSKDPRALEFFAEILK